MNRIYNFAYRLFVLLCNSFIDRNPNYKDVPFNKRLTLFYTMFSKEECRCEMLERIDTLSNNIGRGKYIFCLFIWAVIIASII